MAENKLQGEFWCVSVQDSTQMRHTPRVLPTLQLFTQLIDINFSSDKMTDVTELDLYEMGKNGKGCHA